MIYRNKTRDRWVTVDNRAVRDTSLTWKARGILIYLLSMPDGWDASIKHLAFQGKDGVESVASGLRELESAGYLVRRRMQDKAGMFYYETDIFEVPQSGSPITENPVTDSPDTDNCPVSNTQEELPREERLKKERPTYQEASGGLVGGDDSNSKKAESLTDAGLYAITVRDYAWDTTFIKALEAEKAKARQNPLRYVRNMCIRRWQQTEQMQAAGLKDSPVVKTTTQTVTLTAGEIEMRRLAAEHIIEKEAERKAAAQAKAAKLFGGGK